MKYFLLLITLSVGLSVYAQQRYKYVIIPTYFNDFGNELNPFGLSSAVQGELHKHAIKGIFATNKMPEDYCEALTVQLVKSSSLLRNKLKVELKDCMNKVVWSNEGEGRSKEYREGFGQAVADALKDLDQLPVNTTISALPQRTEPAHSIVGGAETPATGNVKSVNEHVAGESQAEKLTGENYKPANPYFNNTYLVDVVELSDNKKELLILNGEALGYKSRQRIATLSPSGLEEVFTVSWLKPDGDSIGGVARITAAKLEISLKEGDREEVIVLQKL